MVGCICQFSLFFKRLYCLIYMYNRRYKGESIPLIVCTPFVAAVCGSTCIVMFVTGLSYWWQNRYSYIKEVKVIENDDIFCRYFKYYFYTWTYNNLILLPLCRSDIHFCHFSRNTVLLIRCHGKYDKRGHNNAKVNRKCSIPEEFQIGKPLK